MRPLRLEVVELGLQPLVRRLGQLVRFHGGVEPIWRAPDREPLRVLIRS